MQLVGREKIQYHSDTNDMASPSNRSLLCFLLCICGKVVVHPSHIRILVVTDTTCHWRRGITVILIFYSVGRIRRYHAYIFNYLFLQLVQVLWVG